MTEAFVDTGFWLALIDRRDQYHAQAIVAFPNSLRKYTNLVTSNLVVSESYTLIRRRLGHAQAQTFLKSIAASPRLIRIHSTPLFESYAEELLEKFNDQMFCYVDAVSFAIMYEHKITTTLAFDHHFSIMGFTILPTA